MKHALLAVLVPLALSGSALAQQSLKQPQTPDDGVGVDYTQPHMNDLLLRTDPRDLGVYVRDGSRRFQNVPPECIDEARAFRTDDPASKKAYTDCFSEYRPKYLARPAPVPEGPRVEKRPVDPTENRFSVQRMPPVTRHPNAQN